VNRGSGCELGAIGDQRVADGAGAGAGRGLAVVAVLVASCLLVALPAAAGLRLLPVDSTQLFWILGGTAAAAAALKTAAMAWALVDGIWPRHRVTIAIARVD